MRQGLRNRRWAAAVAAAVAVAVPLLSGADHDPGETGRAECRTRVEGSTAVARCFNASPYTDAVELHIECARWWDPDVDGVRVRLGPAEGVELSDRCWFGIAKAWVSHR